MLRSLQLARRSRPLRYLSNNARPPPQPEPLSEGEQALHDKLHKLFEPSDLQVQDISGGCGTFYAISIKSKAFSGLSTVKQHQLVTKQLKEEIAGIHGLQVQSPVEMHDNLIEMIFVS
ncbi:bola-like protein [Sistotremastrum suecicum HHB10207 ss-3]|uniref:Bola-like protein n=1 Tax=Sistotremastrum suecicum HHB10207 ss-3 TaxID=1314776 RepID=A0A166FYY4_9AGAM|nr:bola-like protein [Sistotremastrum suecicum HHB10207 ss-3]